MKKIRKILVAVLVLMLMLTPVVSVSQPVTVQAAAKTTKTTLKKSGGRYYAYENGKKLRNTWRTIQSGKKKYTYYFGSNGAAYQASKEINDGKIWCNRKENQRSVLWL